MRNGDSLIPQLLPSLRAISVALREGDSQQGPVDTDWKG